MKKIYIQPNTVVVKVEQQRPVALVVTSIPQANIDTSDAGIAPGSFGVKRNYVDYNVWDDDWSN